MTVGKTLLFSAAYAGGAAMATCGGALAMLSQDASLAGLTLATTGIVIVSIASIIQGLDLAAKSRTAAERDH